MMIVKPNHVFVAQTDAPQYGDPRKNLPAELPAGTPNTTALTLLRNLFEDAGLDSARYGTTEWNPLGDLIAPGDKVVLKPNWVMDKNRLPGGSTECLVTHTSVIEAVLHYVVKARPASIIVGDAPIQSCDFDNLREVCALNDLVMRFKRLGHDIQIRDFRMTKMRALYSNKIQSDPDPANYCLFDLGTTSRLTPITAPATEFRVSDYDPYILQKHHNCHSHQYLVARPVIDADVVISLPKLKTHHLAGVTGALKNMVGVNGFKEYLPHHRKGSANKGGDCYQRENWLKKFAENSLDRANLSHTPAGRYAHIHLAGLAVRLAASCFGNDRNLAGCWYGNDTVWRMCLDLQNILHYGTSDSKIADTPQRKVITITDAIVAGERDGPLAPSPVPLGIMTLGTNVAALEWVHCLLMQIDPRRVPLVAEAFSENDWPLVNFSSDQIVVHVNGKILPDMDSIAKFSRRFSAPTGWKGHCEKK